MNRPPVRIKGWCPSLYRPMTAGDGLIVRIKPRSATLSSAQARALAAGQPLPAPPSLHEQRAVILEHFELATSVYGKRASRQMRKFGIKFARHHADHDAIKQRFIAVKTLADWHAVLDAYYEQDGPGVPLDDALPAEATAGTDPSDNPVAGGCPDPVGAS